MARPLRGSATPSVKHHIVVHQFDPTVHAGAGISLIARDLIEHAPAEADVSLIGVDADAKLEIGRWQEITIGQRAVRFMPVARLDNRNQDRRLPHSVRFLSGLARHRPHLGRATVHAHRVEVGTALALLHPRASLIQFIHGDASEFLPVSAETFWRFAPRGYLLSERFAVQRAARAIVVNTRAVTRLRRYSPHVAHSKLSWFDSSIFHWDGTTPRPAVPRIGWSGRIEPPKDPLLAVEVLSRLRDRGVDYTAWIGGQGTLEQDVRAALERHALTDRVELKGLLGPEQVADELRGSSAFLMTSSWEGMPRGALEALGTGVPLVTTNVGELRAAVQHGVNGFLSESRDPDELASLLQASLALTPGPKLADLVQDFELHRVIDEIYDLIDGAAPRH
jgi:glycosyltransferase involved in cell wall biosynthesis